MKILIITLFIILINISVYAYDVFPDKELNTLQVIMVKADLGKAWIQSADGYEAEISIGDIIGAKKGTVTEIDEASVIVQIGNTRTKMPVIYGFE